MMNTNPRAVAVARLDLQATVAAIAEARSWVQAFAAEHGMPAAERDDLAVAFSEAVTNVVRHAYPAHVAGEIKLAAATDGDWLTVRVDDRGSGGESTSFGLGLPLMTALADRIEVTPGFDGVGTTVLMEFPMCGAPESGRSTAPVEAVHQVGQ